MNAPTKASSPIEFFIWKRACFAYVSSNTNWHYHPAIQLYYSPEQAITVEIRDSEPVTGKLVLLPSHCVRRVDRETRIFQFTYHPFCIDRATIQYCDAPRALAVSDSLHEATTQCVQQMNAASALNIREEFSRSVIQQTRSITMDPRIRTVLTTLMDAYQQSISIDQLAASVNLSPSRLQHIFKQQVGISVSRYHQWLRLRMSFQRIAEGASPIEAAHEVGFYDQPHFSKLFKRSFGYSPQDLLKRYGDARIHILDVLVS